MKRSLIEEISVLLLRKGYIVKNLSRGCFDVFSRKGDRILLLKILEDANAISEEYSREMETIASYIDAVPLVVAHKAGIELEDNIVYSRYDIQTLNIETFENALENKFPFIRKTNAGLTASIIGDKIKEKREELGLSLHALSQKIGVSGKTAQHYEGGVQEVTLQKAFRLYDVFGGSVFRGIDVFHTRHVFVEEPHTAVSKKYSALGFKATDMKRVPFDVIARKENDLVLTELGDKMRPGFESLSKLMEADRLVIFKKNKPKNIASMKREEFLEIEKAKELMKRIRETSF